MHIDDEIAEKAKKDGVYAIAYAILELARAQSKTATNIKNVDVALIAERIEMGLGAVASAITESNN